jgi:hypothetical protein
MVNQLNGIDKNLNGVYKAVSGTEYLTFELASLRDGVYGDVGIIRVDDAEGGLAGTDPQTVHLLVPCSVRIAGLA